ncbi:MAG: ATPase [Bacteroidales bacterium]|nr:ATPase [Bacteroidales bacterium]MCF8458618.1 ATPase [Bacteroidales bacterium]
MSENQNKKILIADSGATKTSWLLIDGQEKTTFETIGLHPSFIDNEGIRSILQNNPFTSFSNEVGELHFYGAGCGNPLGRELIKESLHGFFPNTQIEVETDLLGACRGLFGNEDGIAVILGTGSNSALYRKGRIEHSQPSLGYILGDEGSGAYLGKSLVAAYLNHDLPTVLQESFFEEYQLNRDQIISAVYRQPFPNRFLASFCPFLSENKTHPFVETLIYTGLNDFFRKSLYKYPNLYWYSIRFCGSIAYHFSDVLKQLCDKYKISCGRIVQSPMDGLVEYHKAAKAANKNRNTDDTD